MNPWAAPPVATPSPTPTRPLRTLRRLSSAGGRAVRPSAGMQPDISNIVRTMAAADLYEDLEWRGMMSDATEGLRESLAAAPVTAYIGFDPTADSLHVGSLLTMMG